MRPGTHNTARWPHAPEGASPSVRNRSPPFLSAISNNCLPTHVERSKNMRATDIANETRKTGGVRT